MVVREPTIVVLWNVATAQEVESWLADYSGTGGVLIAPLNQRVADDIMRLEPTHPVVVLPVYQNLAELFNDQIYVYDGNVLFCDVRVRPAASELELVTSIPLDHGVVSTPFMSVRDPLALWSGVSFFDPIKVTLSNRFNSRQVPILNPYLFCVNTRYLKKCCTYPFSPRFGHNPHLLALDFTLFWWQTERKVLLTQPVSVDDVADPERHLQDYVTGWGKLAGRFTDYRRYREWYQGNYLLVKADSNHLRRRYTCGLLLDWLARLTPTRRDARQAICCNSAKLTDREPFSKEVVEQVIKLEGLDYAWPEPTANFDQVMKPVVATQTETEFDQWLVAEEQQNAAVNAELARLKPLLPRPIKVCHTLTRMTVGGAEWASWLLFAGTDKAVAEIKLCMRVGDTVLTPWLIEHGMDITVIGDRPDAHLQLRRVIAQADVVDFLIADNATKLVVPDEPPVVVGHGSNDRYRLPKPRVTDIDLLISVSAAVDHLTPLDVQSRAARVVVRTGMDIERTTAGRAWRQTHQIPETARVLLWVGRIYSWEKNYLLLRQAIADTESDQTWWIVVGYWNQETKQEEEEWQQFIANKHVVWVKEAANWETQLYYEAADAVVSTSISEGLSIALVQGVVNGLPVFTPPAGGSAEVAVNGVTGVLASFDRTEYLAQLKDFLALDQATWARYGQNAIRLGKALFDAKTQANKTLLAYLNVLSQRDSTWPKPQLDLSSLPQLATKPLIRRPLKVVFILHEPALGGLPWRLCYTAKYLRQLGHDCQLFFLRSCEGGNLEAFLQQEGIPYRIVPDYWQRDYQIRQWLRHDLPDVVMVASADLAPSSVLRGPWANFVWYATNNGAKEFLRRFEDMETSIAGVVCIAESLRAQVPARWQEQTVTINSTTNYRWFKPTAGLRKRMRQELGIADNQIVVAWSGSIYRLLEKRPDILCYLAERLTDVVFLVAVSAIPCPQSTGFRYYQRLLKQQNVVMISAVYPWEMPALLAAADIGLQTSDYEGISQTLLEMAAIGLPLVATDTGGTRELVVEGKNGYLVPVGEYVLLAERLTELVTASAIDREIMGKESCQIVEQNFSNENYLNQLLDLFYRHVM